LSLTGPDGLLKQLARTVLETASNEEITEHLGHEKHGPAAGGTGNVRHGTRAKTVLTEVTGQVQAHPELVGRPGAKCGAIGHNLPASPQLVQTW
jgi:hypothetical protein